MAKYGKHWDDEETDSLYVPSLNATDQKYKGQSNKKDVTTYVWQRDAGCDEYKQRRAEAQMKVTLTNLDYYAKKADSFDLAAFR